jgi:hypothetical protein
MNIPCGNILHFWKRQTFYVLFLLKCRIWSQISDFLKRRIRIHNNHVGSTPAYLLYVVFFPLILKLFKGLVISKLADQSFGKAKASHLLTWQMRQNAASLTVSSHKSYMIGLLSFSKRSWAQTFYSSHVRKLVNSYLRLKQGLQRDVVYLGWPIARSYMSPNAGGGGSCRVSSSNEHSCSQEPK